MLRRTFLQSSAAVAAASFLSPRLALAARLAPHWAALRSRVGDRLINISSPLVACARNRGAGAEALFTALKNPYYLSNEPSLTQTLGWIDAWTSEPSLKGVAAMNAADVAAAIDFARTFRIPPVVKGGGHSYFGNSNRAGSLLIWTHRMREIELHDAYRPVGAPAGYSGVPAVSVGAGCIWGEVYRKVAVEHGRYVQGGGCLTVGVGGFVQGGGFGSFSKQFGTGAANLLEAEVVTADGRIHTVSSWSEPELFFALRGGGGGTFGVVTRLTLKTHPLPPSFGAVSIEIRTSTDASWRELAGRAVAHYARSLFNPTWGEQMRFSRRRLRVDMLCHSLSRDDMQRAWAPLIDWAKSYPKDFTFPEEPGFLAIPGRAVWNPATLLKVPGAVFRDDRPGAPSENVYWQGNREEAAQVLHAYQSAWLPNALLSPARQPELVDALVRAGDLWPVTLHTNKGLGGGSEEAIASTRETAMNPEVLDSFALLICAAEEQPAYPGIPGHEPNIIAGRKDAAGVTAAMREIYRVAPSAGAYVSESDYFQRNWKRAYWGPHYPRLARAKRKYDPQWILRGRNCVEPE